MGKIINSTYVSLDGVVQHPENWTFDYRSDDATRFANEQVFASDGLIMGRHTYDIFSIHWPTASDDEGLADRMNSMPKYVVSNSLTDPTWNNTIVISDDAIDRIRRLKAEPGKDILQFGYGSVTAQLIEAKLLDEIRIWLHPVLVGGDNPDVLLFRERAAAKLRLTSTKTFDSGVVVLSYETDR